MDLWVVAAAAGAGYIAKNLQNLSVDKRENLGGPSFKYSHNVQSGSRNFLQQLRDKTCPLRRLAQQRFQDNAFLDHFSDNDGSIRKDREDGAASISGDALEESLKFEDRNLSRVDRGKLGRHRRCGVHSMRPLGSCLENMEHGTCLCPSLSEVRPVVVSDGWWGDDRCFTEFGGGGEESRRGNMEVSSTMKRFESVEEVREPKKSSNNMQLSSPRSQGPETMLLFVTGMTIGILSATTSWKSEVDKLNNQLKQMENLVQDLHEELDMKELITMELSDEGDPHSEGKDISLSTQEPVSSPSDMKAKKLNEFDSIKTNDKNTENIELLSRIEAELQAELEMLEDNMKASALKRISSVIKLDPDYEPELVEGDLKPTMVNDASDSGNETTDTVTNCSKPANYAVSPWELSLRLHELIESRLELRIKELEVALDDGQNTVYERRFSYSETESSSTHQTPTCICDGHGKRQEYPSTRDFYTNDVNQESVRSTSFMSNEDSRSEDESDMLLIKKIVERRKSGSSLNLKID